jgi:hypothetical protein
MTSMNDETAVLPVTPAPGDPAPGDPDLGDQAPDGPGDGLARELAKAAPRRWWNKGTVALAGAVLLVGGFAGGLQAQKSWGPQQQSGRAAFNGLAGGGFGGGAQGRAGGGAQGGGAQGGGAQGGFQGGARGGGAQGAGAQGGFQRGGGAAPGGTATATGGGATTGTVKLVDGSTIYVQTPDGNVVTVKTDGKTKLSTATTSKLSAVKAGQPVTVQGPAAADGTVTATSVTTQRK